jgi:hypothetical protein
MKPFSTHRFESGLRSPSLLAKTSRSEGPLKVAPNMALNL